MKDEKEVVKATPAITSNIRVKAYPIMLRAVEEGVAYGWMRAHKHDDNPDEDYIKSQINDAVMNSICEYFEFDNSDFE